MAIEYRKLTTKDLSVFIQMRINQLLEEGANPTFDLSPNLEDYYIRHLSDGTFVSWLAVEWCRLPRQIWVCCFIQTLVFRRMVTLCIIAFKFLDPIKEQEEKACI